MKSSQNEECRYRYCTGRIMKKENCLLRKVFAFLMVFTIQEEYEKNYVSDLKKSMNNM